MMPRPPLDTRLPWRLRPDIEWFRIAGRRGEWWIAIDRLRQEIFRCGDTERQLLKALNGQSTMRQLLAVAIPSDASASIGPHEMLAMLQHAHRQQLIVTVPTTEARLGRTEAARRSSLSEMARGLQAYWQKLPWQFVQSRWAGGSDGELIELGLQEIDAALFVLGQATQSFQFAF